MPGPNESAFIILTGLNAHLFMTGLSEQVFTYMKWQMQIMMRVRLLSKEK